MKIALVTDQFAVGGGLEHIEQITRHLTDFRFGIFARGGNKFNTFQNRSNVQLFPEGYDRRYLQAFTPDLIHIHHLKPLFNLYKNPLEKPDVPVLYTLHGAHIRKYTFKKGVFHRPAYFSRYHLEKYLFRRVNRLITVCQSDLELVRKIYGLQNAIYIPNGVDVQKLMDSFHLQKAEMRQKYGLREKSLLFLTVARFDFVKGYDVLMQAISSIKEQLKNYDVQFIFVGEGAEFRRMQKFVTHHSLKNLVVFIKRLHPVYDILIASDVFILPSRWEGMPFVLLEAGYFKLPVIVSSAEAHLEIIEDRKNGIIFRNQDSAHLAQVILEVLRGKYDLSQFAENLYQDIIKNYNLTVSMNKLRKTYQEMITEKVQGNF